MKGRQSAQRKRFNWQELFRPENSGPKLRCHAYIIRREGRVGTLKFWVWVVISISIALALGQL